MYSMICFKILQYKTLHKSAVRRISNNKNFNLFLAKHFSRVDYCGMTSNSRRVFKLFGHNDSILFNKHTRSVLYRRSFSIVPLFSRLLKLRYIFVGSAVGGGIAIQNVSKPLLKKNFIKTV